MRGDKDGNLFGRYCDAVKETKPDVDDPAKSLLEEFVCDMYGMYVFESVTKSDIFDSLGITEAEADAFHDAFNQLRVAAGQEVLDVRGSKQRTAAAEAKTQAEADATNKLSEPDRRKIDEAYANAMRMSEHEILMSDKALSDIEKKVRARDIAEINDEVYDQINDDPVLYAAATTRIREMLHSGYFESDVYAHSTAGGILCSFRKDGSVEVTALGENAYWEEIIHDRQQVYGTGSEAGRPSRSIENDDGRDGWGNGVRQQIGRGGEAFGDNRGVQPYGTAGDIQSDQSIGGDDVASGKPQAPSKGAFSLPEAVKHSSHDVRAIDEEYLDIARDPEANRSKLQEMVDAAAKAAGWGVKVFHGTPNHGFTRIGTNVFYAADSDDIAQTYSGEYGMKPVSNGGTGGGNYGLYANVDNLLVLDAQGDEWHGMKVWLSPKTPNTVTARIDADAGTLFLSDKSGEFASLDLTTMDDMNADLRSEIADRIGNTLADAVLNELVQGLEYSATAEAEVRAHGAFTQRQIESFCRENGYDGVRINNAWDSGGRGADQARAGTIYMFLNPQAQIKSADPVTYDDDGNVIPLSERFNSKKEDIRWSRHDVSEISDEEADRISEENRQRAESFVLDYRAWDKTSDVDPFDVGTTPEYLRNEGVPAKRMLFWVKDINHLKRTHPAMTDSIIEQIPNVINDPVVVMRSRTVPETRYTVFGEAYDENGYPVLVVLDINPNQSKGYDPNTIRVANAYGKDTDAQGFLDRSEIIYQSPNKEKIQRWSEASGLQLPSSSVSESNHSMSDPAENVKGPEKTNDSSHDVRSGSMIPRSMDPSDAVALERGMRSIDLRNQRNAYKQDIKDMQELLRTNLKEGRQNVQNAYAAGQESMKKWGCGMLARDCERTAFVVHFYYVTDRK